MNVVVIDGNVAAGKTRLFKNFQHLALTDDSVCTDFVPEFVPDCPLFKQWQSAVGSRKKSLSRALEEYLFNKRFEEYETVLHGDADIVFLERSVFTSPIFMKANEHLIEEYQTLEQHVEARLATLIPPTLSIYVCTDVWTCHKRQLQRNNAYKWKYMW